MKQGFLVYFDNCRQTRDLADHHYATLWRTIFAYAEKLAADEPDAEAYLKEYISAAPGGVGMALRFVADNVRRDHLRYQAKTAQYRAAQQCSQKKTGDADGELMKYARELNKTSGRSAGGQEMDDALRKQTNSLIPDEEMMKYL